MKHDAGIIREQAKLKEGLNRVLELKNKFYSKDNRIVINNLVNSNDGTSDNATIENVVAHYRSDFPKLDDERWKVNIYCRNKVAGVSKERLDTEMILFEENVKEIKGPLAEFLREHVKAEHHREFE